MVPDPRPPRRLVMRTVGVGVVAALGGCAGTSGSARMTTGASRAPGTSSRPSVTASTTTPAAPKPILPGAVVTAIGELRRVGVAVYDTRTRQTYTYAGEWLNETASIVKLLIGAAALREAREDGRTLSASRMRQLRRMITYSDNDSATALYAYAGGAVGIRDLAEDLELTTTAEAPPPRSWGRTLTCAADQVTLVRAIRDGSPILHQDDRELLWGLMGEVIAEQRWGIGIVEAHGASVQLKNGWVSLSPDYRWRVNSVGGVRSPDGRDYIAAILSRGHTSQAEGIAAVNRISEAIYAALAQPYLPLG